LRSNNPAKPKLSESFQYEVEHEHESSMKYDYESCEFDFMNFSELPGQVVFVLNRILGMLNDRQPWRVSERCQAMAPPSPPPVEDVFPIENGDFPLPS